MFVYGVVYDNFVPLLASFVLLLAVFRICMENEVGMAR